MSTEVQRGAESTQAWIMKGHGGRKVRYWDEGKPKQKTFETAELAQAFCDKRNGAIKAADAIKAARDSGMDLCLGGVKFKQRVRVELAVASQDWIDWLTPQVGYDTLNESKNAMAYLIASAHNVRYLDELEPSHFSDAYNRRRQQRDKRTGELLSEATVQKDYRRHVAFLHWCEDEKGYLDHAANPLRKCKGRPSSKPAERKRPNVPDEVGSQAHEARRDG